MLYYIHGYLSSPNSTKGTLLKKTLNAHPIKYRDCQPEELLISDCLNQISNVIKNDHEVTLIGSSLGGLLAVKTAQKNQNVKKLILLNPAIIPPDTDLNTISDMPQSILQDMIDKNLFEKKLPQETHILVGTEDDLLPIQWVLSFAQKQEATIKFLHDDHSLSKNIKQLPKLIKKII